MRKWAAFFCALLLALTTACAAADTADNTGTTLLAIKVGKADCLLVRSGVHAYLIDTGTEDAWGAISRALKLMGVARLDGVIITHTDKDHGGGAVNVASAPIQVDAWYAPALYTGVKEAKHPAVKAAALRGQAVTWLHAGDTLPLGDGAMTVLGPVRLDAEKENNNSLVLHAVNNDGSMLLTGDMEFPEESTLMDRLTPVDVLKVANHGEGDATSGTLLARLRPRLAVISTNTIEEPDTPDARVLADLNRVGAMVGITQNAQLGVQVTLKGGMLDAQLLSVNTLPEMPRGLEIAGKSVQQDTVSIVNRGAEAADISGWYVRSDKGGEIFIFPNGTTLQPGQTVTVSALDSPAQGDFIWQDEEVWHKKKADQAQLYDVYSRLADTD